MSKKAFISLSFIFLLSHLFFYNCSSVSKNSQSITDTVYFNFCDFQQNLNRQVRIIGNYSGVDEYWGIFPAGKCKEQLSVNFNFNAIYDKLSPDQKELFSKVHNKYWKYYLQIDASGRFEMNGNGYGHLGHNKADFIPDKIFSLTLKEAKKRGN